MTDVFKDDPKWSGEKFSKIMSVNPMTIAPLPLKYSSFMPNILVLSLGWNSKLILGIFIFQILINAPTNQLLTQIQGEWGDCMFLMCAACGDEW